MFLRAANATNATSNLTNTTTNPSNSTVPNTNVPVPPVMPSYPRDGCVKSLPVFVSELQNPTLPTGVVGAIGLYPIPAMDMFGPTPL